MVSGEEPTPTQRTTVRSAPAGRGRRRPRFRWRRVLRWALVAVVAALTVLLSSPYWLPTGWLRSLAERELEEAFPGEATVGQVSIRLGRGLRLRWEQVELTSEAQGARFKVSVDSVYAEAPFGALLRGQLRVPEVTLETVRCELRQGPRGWGPLVALWQEKERELRRRERVAEGERPAPRPGPFQIESILLDDLTLALLDQEGSPVYQTARLSATTRIVSLKPVNISFPP